MLGNRNTLIKIIKAFITEFADANNKLSKYRTSEDIGSLLYYLHSLKGSAGNIAAEDLYLKAAEIEIKLKNQLEITNQEYNELYMAIEEVLSNASFFEKMDAKKLKWNQVVLLKYQKCMKHL